MVSLAKRRSHMPYGLPLLSMTFSIYHEKPKRRGREPTYFTNQLLSRCPAAAALLIPTPKVLDLLCEPGFISTKFNRLQAKNHMISMETTTKPATSSFDNSAYYRDCDLCNVPFSCKIHNIKKCESIDCKCLKVLAGIWRRLLHENELMK